MEINNERNAVLKIKIKTKIDILIRNLVKIMQSIARDETKIRRLRSKQNKKEVKQRQLMRSVKELNKIYKSNDVIGALNEYRRKSSAWKNSGQPI